MRYVFALFTRLMPAASSGASNPLSAALVKPGRGASWNRPINSSRAILYTRLVIGEETLSSTSIFNFSRQSRQIGDFLGRFYLKSVVIEDADADFLLGYLAADGRKINGARVFRLEGKNVGVDLIEQIERGFVGLGMRYRSINVSG
jgi:hypothetical protein